VGEGNENLFYQSPWYFKRSFTCRKILRHGNSGFTSHPKEGVLRIFISFKTPSPWPGSNPQPLGPVASTLTTTPPRRPEEHTASTFSADRDHKASQPGRRQSTCSPRSEPHISVMLLHFYVSRVFSSGSNGTRS
jgi:hypothetical protein